MFLLVSSRPHNKHCHSCNLQLCQVDEQEDIDMRLEMEEEEGDAGDEDDEYDDEEDVVVEERPSEPWVKMLSEIEYNEVRAK